jgi:hypothetical protein
MMTTPQAPMAPGDAGGSTTTELRLLELLVCPLTKGPLRFDATRQELISEKARLAYPVRNGVPLMTAETARTLDDAEIKKGG